MCKWQMKQIRSYREIDLSVGKKTCRQNDHHFLGRWGLQIDHPHLAQQTGTYPIELKTRQW